MLANAALSIVALLAWAYAVQAAQTSTGGVPLFVTSAAAVLVVARRRAGVGLVVVGVMALAMDPAVLERIDVWGVVFVSCTSVGTAVWLKDHEGVRWIASSVPFWAMSKAAPWLQSVALGLVFLGLATGAVGSVVPTRRRRSSRSLLPHLASGALVPVEPRVYPGGQPGDVMRAATVVFAMLAIVLIAVTLAGWNARLSGALAVASAIGAVMATFANWFAGRPRLRVDGDGVHGRVLFREHSIAWREIVELSLRYVFMPGVGGRMVYYCVQSPTRECAFPSSMKGARELQGTIEAATGLAWPAPSITPTL